MSEEEHEGGIEEFFSSSFTDDLLVSIGAFAGALVGSMVIVKILNERRKLEMITFAGGVRYANHEKEE